MTWIASSHFILFEIAMYWLDVATVIPWERAKLVFGLLPCELYSYKIRHSMGIAIAVLILDLL
jgi:hypothetical protein